MKLSGEQAGVHTDVEGHSVTIRGLSLVASREETWCLGGLKPFTLLL